MKKIFALLMVLVMLLSVGAFAEPSTGLGLTIADPVITYEAQEIDLSGGMVSLMLNGTDSGILGLTGMVATGLNYAHTLASANVQFDQNGLTVGIDGTGHVYGYDISSLAGMDNATIVGLISAVKPSSLIGSLDFGALMEGIQLDSYTVLSMLLQNYMQEDGKTFSITEEQSRALIETLNRSGDDFDVPFTLDGTLEPLENGGSVLNAEGEMVLDGTTVPIVIAIEDNMGNGTFTLNMGENNELMAYADFGVDANEIFELNGGVAITNDDDEAEEMLSMNITREPQEDGPNTVIAIRAEDTNITFGYDIIGGAKGAKAGQTANVTMDATAEGSNASFGCTLSYGIYDTDSEDWAWDSANADMIPTEGPTNEQLEEIQNDAMNILMGNVYTAISDIPGLEALMG